MYEQINEECPKVSENKDMYPKTVIASFSFEKTDITLVNYSERSIAVIGDTKSIKDNLKELGGRYNPNLTFDDKNVKGWIFSKKRESSLCNFFKERK